MEVTLTVLIIYNPAAGMFASQVAMRKRYRQAVWFFGGLFFNLPALVAIAGMPEVQYSQAMA